MNGALNIEGKRWCFRLFPIALGAWRLVPWWWNQFEKRISILISAGEEYKADSGVVFKPTPGRQLEPAWGKDFHNFQLMNISECMRSLHTLSRSLLIQLLEYVIPTATTAP